MDPLTILATTTTVISQVKQLAAAGRDFSGALAKAAGGIADLNHLEERAKNRPWYASFGSSAEKEAMDIHIAQTKMKEHKADLIRILQYTQGQQGVQAYKDTLRKVKEQREKHQYRKERMKQTIIEVIAGLFAFAFVAALVGGIFYFIGKQTGRF